jgi:hypothetical protein
MVPGDAIVRPLLFEVRFGASASLGVPRSQPGAILFFTRSFPRFTRARLPDADLLALPLVETN